MIGKALYAIMGSALVITSILPLAEPAITSPTHSSLDTPAPTPSPSPTQDDEVAVRKAVESASAFYVPANYSLTVDRVNLESPWGAVAASLVDNRTGQHAGAMGLIVLAHKVDDQWLVAFPEDGNFYSWLGKVPPSIVDDETKAFFKQLERVSSLTEPQLGVQSLNLKLPWPGGRSRCIGGYGYGQGTHYPDNVDAFALDFRLRYEEVSAVAAGTVEKVVTGKGNTYPEGPQSYGNYVLVDHGGLLSLYAHLDSVRVSEDQSVSQGTTLGISGNSGYSTAAHLHFRMRYSNMDPYKPEPMSGYTGFVGFSCDSGIYYVSDNGPGGGGHDTTPPSGYFTSPSAGSTISSRKVTISVNASDNAGGTGVKEVRFSAIWPGGSWTGIGTDSSEPYSIEWDMCNSNVPDGDVELGMEVWDNSGNVFIWSRDGDANPHITKNYVCTGGGDPIPGDAWETWGWQNKYLAGYANWHDTLTWPNGWPYIWLDYGSGGPFGWGGDEFSLKLQRNVYFPGGDYHFEADSDDGVRVFVDGNKILDSWWDGLHKPGITRYLSAGNHTVTVEYYENLGDAHIGVVWYGPGYPRPDNNPPDGRITSPAHLSATNDAPLTIAADAWDDASGVNRVEFFVWHCQPTCEWRQLGTDYSAPFSYTWDWSSLQDTHVWLTIHIYDNTGKVRMDPGGYVEVDLDRGEPSVIIDSPLDDAYLTTSQIQVQATASDSGSGVNGLQFFAGYTDGTPDYWHEIGWDTDGTDGWSATWDSTAVDDQTDVSFFVYAYDRAWNYQGAGRWNAILDRTAPSSTVANLPSTSPTSFTVNWSGTDTTSGIADYDVQYQDDGGAWIDWQTGVAATSATFSGVDGHTYGFRSRARDLAGNLEAWPSSLDTSTIVSSAASFWIFLPLISR